MTTTRKSTSAAITPSRKPPLTWQRRTNSQASNTARTRPLSVVAAENAAKSPRATPEPEATLEEGEIPRSQIMQNLGSKDPSWFRQTADRGIGSAAYRRNQDDVNSDTLSKEKMGLPGMSQEPTMELEKASCPGLEDTRSVSPSRASSIRSSNGQSIDGKSTMHMSTIQ